MTQQEHDRLVMLKQLATERLTNLRPQLEGFAFATRKVDARIEEYILNVIDNPNRHNVWEQVAVCRYFRQLKDHRFSPAHVLQFIRFAEKTKTSGNRGRKQLCLTPVQCFFAALLYGLRDDQDRRLTTLAYLFIPRKFGKTTFAAVIAVFDMFCGDHNAEAYVAANSHDQAKICFKEIKNILRSFDPSERFFKINREEVKFRNEKIRASSARCLTANARTKDGLFASLAIIDEYAQARNTLTNGGADMKKVLMSSMGPRKEPMTIVITTASEVLDGPFVQELEGVKQVLEAEFFDSEVTNEHMQALLFCPDVDDAEDDPNTWAKVQPHLGITVQADYYEREYQTALLSADYMTEFRTKQLNIFCMNEEKMWIPNEVADKLIAEGQNIFNIQGLGKCVGALDLSVHDDMSAVAYVGFSQVTKCYHAHIDYYLPEQAVRNHPLRELYEKWHQEGHLKYCTGEVIDLQMILNDIISTSKRIPVVTIGYDPYKAQDIVNLLQRYAGKKAATAYKQTNGAFNIPVETFEMAAMAQPPHIQFDDNPITHWQLTNCTIDEDKMNNKKPIKISPNRKIDGIICTLMALGIAISK
jgi:phage terminase large subunit-like protein